MTGDKDTINRIRGCAERLAPTTMSAGLRLIANALEGIEQRIGKLEHNVEHEIERLQIEGIRRLQDKAAELRQELQHAGVDLRAEIDSVRSDLSG